MVNSSQVSCKLQTIAYYTVLPHLSGPRLYGRFKSRRFFFKLMFYYKYMSNLISITKQAVHSDVIVLREIKLDVLNYVVCDMQI